MGEYNPYTPPLGFYFKVSMPLKIPILNKYLELEFSFQSASGLTKEIVTETFREGGQAYDYALPVKTQYSELVLKRGLWIPSEPKPSLDLWQAWFNSTMQEFRVHPANLQISLLRPDGNPSMTWYIKRAWPKKWTIADFNAEENQVVIETMEMRYDSFTINQE
jgi:phage tail-like protein